MELFKRWLNVYDHPNGSPAIRYGHTIGSRPESGMYSQQDVGDLLRRMERNVNIVIGPTRIGAMSTSEAAVMPLSDAISDIPKRKHVQRTPAGYAR